MNLDDVMAEINQFLLCPTPSAWIDVALENQELLLIDHANCEKKAASTAMNLLYRYIDRDDLLKKMSQLAREELLHFEQVVGIMKDRGVSYRHVSSSRYASGLRELVRKGGEDELVDVLICGALIEARSCERFAALVPHLDEALAKFYRSLLRSEGRHYQDYLELARQYAGTDIQWRIDEFREIERELIMSPDPEFRFHSGVPAAA
ncbi:MULTISPECIES: tRNA-(ms[2]io[6]A)-hydroxylase [Thalassolituus]|uniref:tRNA-(ms[2]io[6]A)-hydroxylase n=1 Tax=Thalassolituus TaxID=187492 RepID=UPI0007CF0F68|nr:MULTISPECIES: tRNA-(ms[2]io[6]A)-hydroxylase [Thalassolituus]KZY99588.1 tRNA hydroxylase [Oleibacter sp. HI0075]MED5441606.1 tRNA-(ms[2]io[6]A)-hydroxylase [Pseudomonadota bacterium]MEE3191208.1 tRNA-(ms[2]io[6]A)-hydroxylase [Pseudomonadota bacterium]MEE3209648.1 tRNA-(ms[2]io[6]A)-hydroxylase [Pseudomonadota bacterium]|tara:strand:+ start:1903 stop:2520 length:618 start_codon:yes stop_codon:yes gene_type:complete